MTEGPPNLTAHFDSSLTIVSPGARAQEFLNQLRIQSICVRHQFLQRRVSPARSIRGRDVVRIETGANYHQPAGYNFDALPDGERTD